MKAIVALLLLLPAPVAAEPQAAPDAPLADGSLEAKARSLMHELRCLQCQNQSIADSNASQAAAMRAVVREKIAAGEEPDAVRAWFVERYGEWVAFTPPARADTALLWAAPLIAIGFGGLIAARLFRKGRA